VNALFDLLGDGFRHMRRTILILAGVAGLGACRAHAPLESDPTHAAEPPVSALSTEMDRMFDARLGARPSRGVELGLHQYDGKLPDLTLDRIQLHIDELERDIARLKGIPAAVEPISRMERAALVTTMEAELFDLETRRLHRRNPMFYLDALDLTPYISRDYAPLTQRVRAIVAIAAGTPTHLATAMRNLEQNMPRTFVQTALLQTRGMAEFVKVDVVKATASLADPPLAGELANVLATMADALHDYEGFLERALPHATDDFALGEAAFSQMLAKTQGIDIDLARLEAALRADLDRNAASMAEAARAIDPTRSVAEVVASVGSDKSPPDQVLVLAAKQAAQMRDVLLARDIVTIPTDDIAEVVATPPFMRWNSAFLSPAGVFESESLPSFYYISPPDPAWPEAKQRAYIPGEADLLFITIHEVWPGHFLHGLHLKVTDSRILKGTWNYTTGEGWAHYAEELMWEIGVSTEPAIHIGQLQNALLRNVRAISAIGLHTQSMSVETSKRMFIEQGFQDEATAEQQTIRGTFDPMYLAYTTGKLAIRKLREDLRAKRGDAFSLKAFHDELLSYGGAPLSAIRAVMLPDDDGPML